MGAGGTPLAALVLPHCFTPSQRCCPLRQGCLWGCFTVPLLLYGAEVLGKGSCLPGSAPFSPPSLHPSLPLPWSPQCQGVWPLSYPRVTFQPGCEPSSSPSSDLPSYKPGVSSFPSCPRCV